MTDVDGAVSLPGAMPMTTGRWSAEEHVAFQDGLKRYGANWRAIQRLVPTRTLIQIRTHAQKYFNKLGVGNDPAGGLLPRTSDEELASPQSFAGPRGPGVAAAGVHIQPYAVLRHVALEPVHPADPLGIRLTGSAAAGVSIEAFVPVQTSAPLAGPAPITVEVPLSGGSSRPVAVAAAPVVTGVAEESDLVRVGDIIVGVSGVATLGLDPAQVMRAISAARNVTPGGILVLHVCAVPVPPGLVEEATFQCAAAAAQLLGSAQVAETAQQSIVSALSPAPHQWPMGGGGGTAAYVSMPSAAAVTATAAAAAAVAAAAPVVAAPAPSEDEEMP